MVLPKYQISPLSSIYGKTNESKLVNTCFELFSVNRNLVKNYSSNDGHTENFVDEISEISFSDFGIVEYRALDGYGINLDKYLGYLPDDGMNYSFEDKIFAVKRIINELDFHNDNISYCISGLEYDESKNTLTIYFKFVCDGILISDAEYHALFEIANNGLVHARFNAVTCSRTNDFVSLIPQRYANMILYENGETADDYVIMPVMFDAEDNSPYKTVKWAKISSSSEVIE